MQRKLRVSTAETLVGSHRTPVPPTRGSGHSEVVLQGRTAPGETFTLTMIILITDHLLVVDEAVLPLTLLQRPGQHWSQPPEEEMLLGLGVGAGSLDLGVV